MSDQKTQVSIKGRQTTVAAIEVDGFKIVTTGKWLRQAGVDGEDFELADPAANPASLVAGLKAQRVRADVFSFVQRLPDVTPRHQYRMEWDNVAALPILGYTEWWEKRLSQDTRRNVRLAAKRGIEVRNVPFDDEFAEGIRGIYNESEFRQGRRFWHYGKDHETVKRENGTFVERSEFIGAYQGAEMVGFIKLVHVGKLASIMQILAKGSCFDKKPMNALMAKAVEICNEKGSSHLLYRKYVYHRGQNDALTEFKRRNGFEHIRVPRYFVPLTAKGNLALKLNLHQGIKEWLPPSLVAYLLKMRANYYQLGKRKEIAGGGAAT